MSRIPKIVGMLALTAAFLLSAAAAPGAEKDEKKRRRNYVVGEYTYKKLAKIAEHMEVEEYVEVRKILDQMSRRSSLNPHEKALMWQMYGYLEAGLEDFDAAVVAFENCVAEDALPEATQLRMQYNLAQLYLGQEDFAKAADTLNDWFTRAENPSSDAYYLLAISYMQQGKFNEAFDPAKKAVDISAAPKEPWLLVLMALYYEKRNYEEIANVLEELVVRFSSRTYWVQLSAVYSELGRDEDSLAVMELAYDQDFLESDNELRRLAQMYLFHQVPYYAAKVVEKGLASEQIEADEEAYELLANSWLSAREYDKALSPLARAAALSQGGDLYVRLAHVRIEREEWNEARNALSSAIDKGDLRHPGNAHLLLGIANYSAKRPNAAKSAFRQARNYDDSKKSADQWLRHISREEAQEEQLIQ